jgi:predicted short-subunit dehydrogenase-like oxidoreductase (DUF2520 family)
MTLRRINVAVRFRTDPWRGVRSRTHTDRDRYPRDEDWIMIVGVIGAGRVGAVLGAALREAGHDVVAVSGASPAAKHLLPGVAHLQPDEVAARATDLLIVAVPDDALSGVISGLARMGVLQPNQIVAHTSGAHGLDVLAPAIAAGAQPLALHPAMTFAGTAGDLERLRGVSFGVTAPPSLVGAAAALVEALGGSHLRQSRPARTR